MADYLPANSLCARHQKTRAVAVCARCGRFLCSDCLHLGTGAELCEDCLSLRPTGDASGMAIAAALTGFGAMAIAPLGLVAISLAIAALTRGETEASRGTKVLSAIAITESVAGGVLLFVLASRVH